MADGEDSPRAEVLRMLVTKIAEDEYPSTTMMDLAERLLEPNEVASYAEVLMEKVASDTYPSIPMIVRLLALSGR
jgi:hypothetical protein